MFRDEEYIKQLIKLLESDKRAVMFYMAFELAVPVFTIKDLAFGQSALASTDAAAFATKLVLVTSLALFLMAALFHWLYWRRIHLNEFAVSRILLSGTGEQARELVFGERTGLWGRHGWKYIAGHVALGFGMVTYLAFFAITIF
ncbi:MAG: hypothetical protein ABI379_05525 [Rhodanobacter sp.]